MENIFENFKEHLGGKREETISNHEAGMLTAKAWALRSKDPSTQVGACIIHEDGRVLSTGYNGTPIDWNDNEFPWDNKVSEIGEQNTKYPYVIHAEMNAICNYKGLSVDFKNATIYVTLFPCINCAKLIAQSGIKRVIYLVDDRLNSNNPDVKRENLTAKLLLAKKGIECIKYDDIYPFSKLDINIEYDEERKAKVKRYIKEIENEG